MLRLPVLAVAASLSVPALATADIAIKVPANLLGGRVAPANAVTPDPGDIFAGDGVSVDDPDFWGDVWPDDAGPIEPPADFAAECDENDPESCGIWLDDAAGLPTVPLDAPAASASLATPPESTVAVARRLTPKFGTWMVSQTPTLRWTAEPGATRYNVQIYLGPRRVASAWTTGTSLRLPKRVIDQGRYYMWGVWPGFGPANAPKFKAPIGRSIFGVILRPRVVFHAAKHGVVGEVRPRIPGGVLRLSGPASLRGMFPAKLRIPANSRFRLNLGLADAQRLTARLVDQGNRPPKGLRRKGD